MLREEAWHLNIGGPRGWSTLCGRESSSFVDIGEEDEVTCGNCLKALAKQERQNANND